MDKWLRRKGIKYRTYNNYQNQTAKTAKSRTNLSDRNNVIYIKKISTTWTSAWQAACCQSLCRTKSYHWRPAAAAAAASKGKQ